MLIKKATLKDNKVLQELSLLLFKKFEKLNKTDKLDYSYWLTKKQYNDFEKLIKKKDCVFYMSEIYHWFSNQWTLVHYPV